VRYGHIAHHNAGAPDGIGVRGTLDGLRRLLDRPAIEHSTMLAMYAGPVLLPYSSVTGEVHEPLQEHRVAGCRRAADRVRSAAGTSMATHRGRIRGTSLGATG
jgi:hypothetical protein